MKLYLKKNYLKTTILFACFFNSYAFNVQDLNPALYSISSSPSTDISNTSNTNATIPILNDINSYNYSVKNDTEIFSSFTTIHEDHILLTQNYFNHETGQIFHGEHKLDRDFFDINEKTNHFDCQLPLENDTFQTSLNNINDSNRTDISSNEHDILEDHLKRDAIEQNQQTAEYNRIVKENNAKNNVFHTTLKNNFEKQPTIENLIAILSSPIFKRYVEEIKYSIINREAQKNSGLFRKKQISNIENEIKFLDAIISNKITELLEKQKNPHLPLAKAAFNKLKKLWPWKYHTFLISNEKNGSGESGFIAKLDLNNKNIMKIAEIDLITRQDYINKYADAKIIEEYKKHSLSLQKSKNPNSLFVERDRLRSCVEKNGENTNITTNICLAIAEKAVYNPARHIFYGIAHASSLADAQNRLKHLEMQVLDEAQQKNIIVMSELKKSLIEVYGFDILEEALDCYTSRPDYINTAKNESLLSNPLKTAFHNIEHRKLPLAHTELVHLKKKALDGLEALEITDPLAQKEQIIKDFGEDIVELSHGLYKGRTDYKNLINYFIPIDVHNTSIEILNNNNTYASVSDQFHIITQHVFNNAKLCGMDFAQEFEADIIHSLHIIQAPRNDAEFVFNVTVVDHILTDLQCQVDAIVTGKPTVWQRSSELFIRGICKFVHGLNPLNQATSIYELIHGVGNLAFNIMEDTIDRTLYPNRPKDLLLTTETCESLVNVAKFTTDLLFGDFYLSKTECLQRHQMFLENYGSAITPENIVDLTAQVAADFVFAKGFASAFIYLKKIDAASRLEGYFAKFAHTLKKGFDTHLANNPIVVTAEGIALQMSNDIKNLSEAAKEIITDSHILIEKITTGTIDTALIDLKSIGNNTWKSPGGLIYKPDKKFGNRIQHVLAHAEPNSMKNLHTVFNVPKDEILKLIDEAWTMKGAPLISDSAVYIVDMKKSIGLNGESAIKIVVIPGTSEIITAYPVSL